MSAPGKDATARHRCAVLDAMGVIYKHGDDVGEVLIPYLREKGCPFPAEEIERAYTECSLGRMTSKEFWDRLGVGGVASDVEYCLLHELTESLFGLLERLTSAGVRVACVSNDVSEWSRELRRRFDLDRYIGLWVVSGDVGVRKPDEKIYRLLLERVGVSAPEVVFVDDKPANLDTAARRGMSTVVFGDRRESVGAHVRAVSIERLAELLLP